MDQTFADRLARIHSNAQSVAVPGAETLDLIGGTGPTASTAKRAYPTAKAPLSYDQRFKMAIVNNLILGFIWMAITGFVAANFFACADFLAGATPTDDSLRNIRVGLAVALVVSFGLCYWVVKEAMRDLGKVHGMPASLAVGCVLGLVAGAGPVTIFNLAVEMGYL